MMCESKREPFGGLGVPVLTGVQTHQDHKLYTSSTEVEVDAPRRTRTMDKGTFIQIAQSPNPTDYSYRATPSSLATPATQHCLTKHKAPPWRSKMAPSSAPFWVVWTAT
jgi:hypothetical protein